MPRLDVLPRSLSAVVVALVLATGASAAAAVPSGPADPSGEARIETQEDWIWPVAAPFRLDRDFVAPAHEYGPGHRGIDLEPLRSTDALAPAGGVVAFSGAVAGRGVLTIDHGEGLVTTLEPIESDLGAGSPVRSGDVVGSLAVGGHSAPGRLHFGVRLHGDYVNPLLLLGGIPRAVLLPCC
jgi:murein DD-endopeptidase MepM/ murein hydrolase activator NlpD